VVLVYAGKAERIEDSQRVFRSPSTFLVVPSVIRLQRYIACPARPAIAFTKKNILKRDAYTCQYCGRNGGERMTIDHVVPKSLGGRTVWENLVSACRTCNLKKSNNPPESIGMRLLRPPAKPLSSFYLGFLARTGHRPPAWDKYLPRTAETPLPRADQR
jgi:5-methylcytosine-specific restriction endonuclease McrA